MMSAAALVQYHQENMASPDDNHHKE